MQQQDAQQFVMALNAIAGFVPPMMMQPLVSSPVAMMLQAVANGQMTLRPEAEPRKGEGPRLVQTDEPQQGNAT